MAPVPDVATIKESGIADTTAVTVSPVEINGTVLPGLSRKVIQPWLQVLAWEQVVPSVVAHTVTLRPKRIAVALAC